MYRIAISLDLIILIGFFELVIVDPPPAPKPFFIRIFRSYSCSRSVGNSIYGTINFDTTRHQHLLCGTNLVNYTILDMYLGILIFGTWYIQLLQTPHPPFKEFSYENWSVSWLNYLFRVVVNLSKERIDYQMAAVGGIRIEFFVVVLVVNIMWCRLARVFYFAIISTIDVVDKNSMYTKASIVMTDRLRCFDLELLKRRKTTCSIYLPIFM